MATKIRLQRFGKKGRPFYHVVVADSRSPRDGKFIERIGSYDPNTNPATIDINFDKALDWVNKGAQPTDTCRGLLSYKGVMYKKHLEGGILKGALTAEQAETKFNDWMRGKEGEIEGKKDLLTKSKDEVKKAALAAEAKKKEDMAAVVLAKNTPPADEVVEEPAIATEAAAEEPEQETEAVEETETETEPVTEEPAVATDTATEETQATVEAPAVEAETEAPAEEAEPETEAPAEETEKDASKGTNPEGKAE